MKLKKIDDKLKELWGKIGNRETGINKLLDQIAKLNIKRIEVILKERK